MKYEIELRKSKLRLLEILIEEGKKDSWYLAILHCNWVKLSADLS